MSRNLQSRLKILSTHSELKKPKDFYKLAGTQMNKTDTNYHFERTGKPQLLEC